jgi:DNA repair protein RecO (recombination protein O)
MKQLVTRSIILSRTDYGEADRIINLLTPEYGKLALMARGVRKVKSKLAGGIELFSVSEITFIKGRGDIGALVSTRLVKYYDQIVKDLERTMLGYELIKQLNRATEDEPEAEYFDLLQQAFEALNDAEISAPAVRLWFGAQLLRLGGHMPNLETDITGKRLVLDMRYSFDLDHMAFRQEPEHGQFGADHIKLLRFAFGHYMPKVLSQVQGGEGLLQTTAPLIQALRESHM